MEQNLISNINGIDIVTVEKDGEIYVPIKPICDALGIEDAAQRVKIQNDEFLASTGSIIESVAADGKTREMFALPLRYIYGWLATINPGKVAPEAREAVSRYRRECYEVLYDHFQKKARRATEQAEREAILLKNKLHFEESIKQSRQQVKRIDEQLAKLQEERLCPQQSLF